MGSAQILRHGPALCVVTLGAEGSYFQSQQGDGRVPPFNVETVDAVGCGDAFMAGVLSRLTHYADWHEALAAAELTGILRYANAVGALTARTPGVIPALPSAGTVEEFLQRTEPIRELIEAQRRAV